ncbi:hypothetical protein LLG90_24120 [Aromatoleum toluclasticum]|uniref:hypothetical protein n=1 Tax=Aromatoleum toluclasticum TaxID=92003 RepID=UPI001D183BC7|nr:hypothetical protein [Aromatoleum toluclasticum]MCC4118448.1 hypothetical protein [Aromatoleum toluclasticum]
MLVFLDTEFTSFDEPRLISAGLVAEDEYRWIYTELDGEHWYKHASEFVLQEVVPLLDRRYGWEQPAAAAARIRKWCEKLPEMSAIVCDSDYDWDLFRGLMLEHGSWPDVLVDQPVPVQWSPRMHEFRQDYLLRYGLSAHNARADAKALRFAFLAQRELPPEPTFGAADFPKEAL